MLERRELAVTGDRSLTYSRAVAEAVNTVCRLDWGEIDLTFDDEQSPELGAHLAVLRASQRSKRRGLGRAVAHVDLNDLELRDAFFAVAPYSLDARAWRDRRDGAAVVYDVADSSSSVVLSLTAAQEREVRARLGAGADRLSAFGHWRVPGEVRLMGLIGAVAMTIYLFAQNMVDGTDPAFDAFFAGLLSSIILGSTWLYLFRPYLRLVDGRVVAKNIYRTYRFDVSRVVAAEPGYWGLAILDADGKALAIAWAVQRSNWSRMTGERTRSDEIAATLIRAARESRGEDVGLVDPLR